MITLRNLCFARAGEKLVDGASLQIHAGHKVGLVGANGCGKSTFLALLTDAHHAESGDTGPSEVPTLRRVQLWGRRSLARQGDLGHGSGHGRNS